MVKHSKVKAAVVINVNCVCGVRVSVSCFTCLVDCTIVCVLEHVAVLYTVQECTVQGSVAVQHRLRGQTACMNCW
jgi:hypothetical protein